MNNRSDKKQDWRSKDSQSTPSSTSSESVGKNAGQKSPNVDSDVESTRSSDSLKNRDQRR